jgi:hypothetical protein
MAGSPAPSMRPYCLVFLMFFNWLNVSGKFGAQLRFLPIAKIFSKGLEFFMLRCQIANRETAMSRSPSWAFPP